MTLLRLSLKCRFWSLLHQRKITTRNDGTKSPRECKAGKLKAIDLFDLAEKNACLPSELRCLICTKYIREAVIIPCCHQSFCERCIHQVLTQKSKCPECSSDKISSSYTHSSYALFSRIEV
ncbi:hypothetical protein AgCh_039132 [Apium graveolens]